MKLYNIKIIINKNKLIKSFLLFFQYDFLKKHINPIFTNILTEFSLFFYYNIYKKENMTHFCFFLELDIRNTLIYNSIIIFFFSIIIIYIFKDLVKKDISTKYYIFFSKDLGINNRDDDYLDKILKATIFIKIIPQRFSLNFIKILKILSKYYTQKEKYDAADMETINKPKFFSLHLIFPDNIERKKFFTQQSIRRENYIPTFKFKKIKMYR